MRFAKTVLSVLILGGAAGLPSPAGAASVPTLEQAFLSAGACEGCQLSSIDRRLLTPDVAEYSFAVRVGPGEFEVVGLHRVVRERAPFVPAPTSRALFMAHGDVWGFDAAFLASAATPAVPDDQSLPVFLAENGVDVWGIDFRWTRVPAGTSDFTFMESWSVETDARDLGIGLAVARTVRGLTGNGYGKLHLLGWSRGGIISYAYLSEETQRPALLRQVRGFIPVDIYLKVDDPELRLRACQRHALDQARLDAGEVAEGIGQLASVLGALALAAPSDPSPVLPGLTNRQAALLTGAATFALAPDTSPVPHYHFTGGTFDADGVPDGLLYTSEDLLFTFLAAGSPWQPLREFVDSDAATCDGPEAPDVPWDDHLEDVTVPVLYVGAAGAFGETGVFTTTLLGSSDVTVHVVNLLPPELAVSDFGHGDIFSADDAGVLVWEPLLAWLQSH